MSGVELAVATRVLSKPIQDLYALGKSEFSHSFQKWKNEKAFRGLVRRIAAVEKVKTFWQRDKQICLSEFYYPSKVTYGDGTTKPAASLKAFPRSDNIVIQGTVGQGKSIFLRYLCIQELGDAGSERIPVFVELRMLTQKGLLCAITSALDTLGFDVTDRLFELYAESGKMVFLLDGFDELDESLIKPTIAELEYLSEKYPNLQLIVTSRPNNHIQNSRHFTVVNLAPLAPGDREPFFNRIGIKGNDISRLLLAIERSSAEVSSLLTTPLMLTLFAIVYKSEMSIPNELSDFFEVLFQTLFTKHDKSKPGFIRPQKSGLGERGLQQLFQAFCFYCLKLRLQTTLSNEAFHQAYEKARGYLDVNCKPEDFKHDIVNVACLMQEESYHLHFIHKSVLEFYAALFVKNLNDELSKKVYETLRNTTFLESWGQVLIFLSQIDKYRFTKYYAIPVLHSQLERFGLSPPFDNIPVSDVLTRHAFNRIKVRLSMQKDHIKATALEGFSFHPFYFGELVRHFFYFIFDERTFLSEDHILMAYPTAEVIDDGAKNKSYKIAWDQYVSDENFQTLSASFSQLVKKSIENLRMAEEYLHSENNKSIFLDI